MTVRPPFNVAAAVNVVTPVTSRAPPTAALLSARGPAIREGRQPKPHDHQLDRLHVQQHIAVYLSIYLSNIQFIYVSFPYCLPVTVRSDNVVTPVTSRVLPTVTTSSPEVPAIEARQETLVVEVNKLIDIYDHQLATTSLIIMHRDR